MEQQYPLHEFERVAFADTASAAAFLENLLVLTGPDIAAPLSDALSEAADPLRALVGLTRFLEHSNAPQADAAFMLASPRYLRMLTTLFSQSNLLSDILCRNPEYGRWLWEDAALERARTSAEALDDVRRALHRITGYDARCAWMRQYSRRELLRIAAREIFMHAPFTSVVADISLLADVMLEAARIAAHEHLSSRFDTPVSEDAPGREVSFCILALGKLGGAELNFSSDIDLLFIYSADGYAHTQDGLTISTEEYFRKLSELVIKALSEQTSEGRVFRVDMRLRPFGRSGPLACTLDDAVEYYSTFGRAWERQALIKARPCAGDLTLGKTLLERLRPFIYPRYFDDATLEDIRGIKQQTETVLAEKARTEREVKLGKGGIRDIEFTVQMLQMLDGGRWPDSRTTNTLTAIRALGQRQRLTPFEAETLERNYIFLRKVEHRLQIEGGLQTHVLPEEKDALNLLARRLGYETGEAFMNVYRERARETRLILDRFLAVKGDGNLWVIALLDPDSEYEAGFEKLRGYGFHDPARARRELLLLANGPEGAPYTRDTAQQFAAITPLLLEAIADTPDPDATLLRFGQILAQLPVPATLYSLLRSNTRLVAYLTTLIANSDYFAQLLVSDISLLDLLGTSGFLDTASARDGLEAQLNALEQAADPVPALYRLRDGETLKVALRDLVQGISIATAGDELSLLADVIVGAVTERALTAAAARYGQIDAGFAVVALGKFGGREMGYGSDLDLIFVYDQNAHENTGAGISPTEYFSAVAAQILNTLKEPTRYGVLYDVDARLRPDGSKGVLAITDERLRIYYLEEGRFWERLALMKARAVAGDPAFMAHIETLTREIAFSKAPDRSELEQIETLRKQLAAAAPAHDLKRREGGIAEIEFATRLLQLRHVASCPELKHGGVFGALDMLKARDLIADAVFRELYDGYAFFRRLLNRARMMRGSTSACVPGTPDALRRLRLCLGLEDDPMVLVRQRARNIHSVYKDIFDAIWNETS